MKNELKKRKDKIKFECIICGKALRGSGMRIIIENPTRDEWQQVWMHKSCCKKVFKNLGKNLVVVE